MAAHVAADDLESMLFFGKIGCFKEAHGAFHAHVLQPDHQILLLHAARLAQLNDFCPNDVALANGCCARLGHLRHLLSFS